MERKRNFCKEVQNNGSEGWKERVKLINTDSKMLTLKRKEVQEVGTFQVVEYKEGKEYRHG